MFWVCGDGRALRPEEEVEQLGLNEGDAYHHATVSRSTGKRGCCPQCTGWLNRVAAQPGWAGPHLRLHAVHHYRPQVGQLPQALHI